MGYKILMLNQQSMINAVMLNAYENQRRNYIGALYLMEYGGRRGFQSNSFRNSDIVRLRTFAISAIMKRLGVYKPFSIFQSPLGSICPS